MTHWLILPIMLPAFFAPFVVLAARYQIGIQRVFSVASILAVIGVALGLAWQTSDGTVLLYQLGDWAAPFGIVLVGDRLSTLMVLLTGVLALFVLLYAIGSKWDERGRHFHALFQFQVMGIMGAFLTGDTTCRPDQRRCHCGHSHRCCVAAAGVCNQGGGGAFALLASFQLCRGASPRGCIICNHDQGGCLCDHPRLYHGVPP